MSGRKSCRTRLIEAGFTEEALREDYSEYGKLQPLANNLEADHPEWGFTNKRILKSLCEIRNEPYRTYTISKHAKTTVVSGLTEEYAILINTLDTTIKKLVDKIREDNKELKELKKAVRIISKLKI